MEALQAVPQTISEIFNKEKIYIIPEYQRPYSWDKDQCDKLWEDLVDFYEQEAVENSMVPNDKKYFLGNIVLFQKDNESIVVDGQQRLTTILLLFLALFKKARLESVLKKKIFTYDEIREEVGTDLRIQSRSVEDENEKLKSVFLAGNIMDSRYSKNLTALTNCIDKWDTDLSSNKFENFVRMLLDNVVLLPILCGSEDDALTIFGTLNDRGLSLSDVDIFKAALHRQASLDNKLNEFSMQWNELFTEYNPDDKKLDYHIEDLFRIYMHIDRALRKKVDKEVGLRRYFQTKHDDAATLNGTIQKITTSLAPWDKVMSALMKINHAVNYFLGECPDDAQNAETCNDCPRTSEPCKWYQVLHFHTNQYWQYPIFTFMFKHMDDNGSLGPDATLKLAELLKCTVRYFYTKGLVYNSLAAVKDTSFKVARAIMHEEEFGDYNAIYAASLDSDFDTLLSVQMDTRPKMLRGLCYIAAYLVEGQDDLLPDNLHIEHILPREWNNYHDWDEGEAKQWLNRIGNLVLWEERKNIKARDKYFERKKELYKDSCVVAANELCKIKEWNPDSCARRDLEIVEKIHNFLMGK